MSQIPDNVHIFAQAEELAASAAAHVSGLALQAVAAQGRFTVAFSGGSLPKILCPVLLQEPLRSTIDWSAWHIFWADERCVPLDDPESNYRLLREQLLAHVDIPAGQIYPIDDSLDPPAAAQTYQDHLHQLFTGDDADPVPRFDLILLGMGPDGHTASLFPNHPLLTETTRWVAPIEDSPKPPPERITLTLPVLNSARQVAFITTGAAKAEALAQVLTAPGPGSPLPAGRVQPSHGALHWFVDEAAAAQLPND